MYTQVPCIYLDSDSPKLGITNLTQWKDQNCYIKIGWHIGNVYFSNIFFVNKSIVTWSPSAIVGNPNPMYLVPETSAPRLSIWCFLPNLCSHFFFLHIFSIFGKHLWFIYSLHFTYFYKYLFFTTREYRKEICLFLPSSSLSIYTMKNDRWTPMSWSIIGERKRGMKKKW